MSEEKEPTLIIKSEDLQDPKKLAFVKAIVGSHSADNNQSKLVFVQTGIHIPFLLTSIFVNTFVEEVHIKISNIKLEPRLLIGEPVNVSFYDDGVCLTYEGQLTKIDFIEGGDVEFDIWPSDCDYPQEFQECSVSDLEEIKPSLQWLKENFEVI